MQNTNKLLHIPNNFLYYTYEVGGKQIADPCAKKLFTWRDTEKKVLLSTFSPFSPSCNFTSCCPGNIAVNCIHSSCLEKPSGYILPRLIFSTQKKDAKKWKYGREKKLKMTYQEQREFEEIDELIEKLDETAITIP